MKTLDESTITAAVIARHAQAPDARLREITTALVTHLHDFVREVRLTENEWLAAINFLTEVGHFTDDKRQEFILLSDVLGVSMLVTALNQHKPANCTEATVFGPFHVADSPHFADGADIANGAPGQPCYVSGTIRGDDGEPVAGAVIEVWQADAEGFYDVQREGLDAQRARGTFVSQADGSFRFKSIVAEPYPIPHDGPVGRLLSALGRHPWRPAHLHFRVVAPGYETLVTHVFRSGGPYLDSDAVFGVRASLIADWVLHEEAAPNTGDPAGNYYTLDFDFVLAKGALAAA